MTKLVVYEATARIAKAIGHPGRARILDLLIQSERHVDDVAQLVDAGVTTVSNHLQVLRSAGLVDSRRDGTRIYYRIADASVLRAWLALRSVAEGRSPDMREYMRSVHERDALLDPIDARSALELAQRGDVTLIDVRPTAEYRAGHLPGAVSMPPDTIDAPIPAVPAGRTAIAYCRDRYCVFAPTAAERLRERGIPTRILEIGLAEWRDLGLPLDTDTKEAH